MTYEDLKRTTAEKKVQAIKKINAAINGPAGWLAKAEIERDPGTVAWLWLAKDFCETLAEHVGEFIEQAGGVDSPDAREIGDIYMAYEDDDPELYNMLPVEAQLFTEEA